MAKRQLPYTHVRNGRMFIRIPYKKGNRWTAIERRVADEDEALAKIAEIKQQLGILGPEAFDGDKMTMRDLLGRYQIAYPEKPKWYTQPVIEFFGDRKIRTLTYGDLKQFRASREAITHSKTGQPRTAATVNRELEIVRAVVLYAFNHGWLKINIWKAGPALTRKSLEQRRTRIPTLDEEERLIAACTDRRAHIRLYVIATLDTGLRKSALQDLTWKDVDWENKMLSVPTARFANKQRPPLCGLSSRLFFALREAFERSDKKPDSKILGGVQDFKRAYHSACKAAEIEGLRFNDLRHGYATHLMQAGVPQHLAMKAAGHTNSEIHAIYTNVDFQIAREVANKLDAFHASRQMQTIEEFSSGNDLVN